MHYDKLFDFGIAMDLIRTKDVVHEYPDGKNSDSYPYSQSAKLFDTNQLFLYSEKISPGHRASAPHFHQSIDEIIYVVKGIVWAIEGEREELLERGDSVCFYSKSGKLHYLENRSAEDVEFLIFRRSIKDSDAIFSVK